MANFTPSKKTTSDFNGGVEYRNKVDTPSAQDLNNLVECALNAQSEAESAKSSIPKKVSQLTNDSGFLTNVPQANANALGGIKTNRNKVEDSISLELPIQIDSNGKAYVSIEKISSAMRFGLANVFKATQFVSQNRPAYNATEVEGRYYAVESWNGYLVVNVPWEAEGLTEEEQKNLANLPTLIEKVESFEATINGLSKVATSGDYNDLLNLPVIPIVYEWALAESKPTYTYEEITNKPIIPTKTSELTNNSGYITSSALTPYAKTENTYTKKETDNAISKAIEEAITNALEGEY